jgi:hypothetical protein
MNMKITCVTIEEHAVDFLDNRLDAVMATAIEKHMESCPACEDEIKRLQQLLQVIEKSDTDMPSDKLRNNFNRMLQEDQVPVKSTGKVFFLQKLSPKRTVAAAILLLVIGAGIGLTLSNRNNKEFAALQKEMKDVKESVLLTLLKEESASERIRAVNYLDEMPTPDQRIINALIHTMNKDKNVNVRLAAVYSLVKFYNDRTVYDSMVTSLGEQTEPILQMVLMNILAQKKDSKAMQQIRSLLSNDKTTQEVKDFGNKIL